MVCNSVHHPHHIDSRLTLINFCRSRFDRFNAETWWTSTIGWQSSSLPPSFSGIKASLRQSCSGWAVAAYLLAERYMFSALAIHGTITSSCSTPARNYPPRSQEKFESHSLQSERLGFALFLPPQIVVAKRTDWGAIVKYVSSHRVTQWTSIRC
jgi:hypothetical protein